MNINIGKISLGEQNLFRRNLLNWYDGHSRILPWRNEPTPYRVWVSEIMLQQTRVDTVIPFFQRFMEKLPNIEALAKVGEEELMKLWEGLGYYSRARNLKKAAIHIMDEYQGVLPETAEELTKLEGIGPYTAGAISSIAYGKKEAAVDGNVYRVMARYLGDERDLSVTAVKKEIGAAVNEVLPEERIGDFNQALMELGALICAPNGAPKCGECPLKAHCKALAMNKVMEIPTKKKKNPRKIEEKTVLLLRMGGQFGIRKRGEQGLLAGLWEYPNLEGVWSEDEVAELLELNKIRVLSIVQITPWKHIFSHVEWLMSGYFVEIDYIEDRGPDHPRDRVHERKEETASPEDLLNGVLFIDEKVIRKEYSIPTAFKGYKKDLKL